PPAVWLPVPRPSSVAPSRHSPPPPIETLGRDQPEGDALVDTRLAGKPKHPFTDGVALDLVGAAADAVGQVGQEVEAPATVEGAGGAEQVKGELPGAVDVFTDGQLDDRAFRPGRFAP